MVYALMIDEMTAGGATTRAKARWSLNEKLDEPLDEDEAEEWRRERWGATPDALMEQEQQEDWLDDFTVD